MLLALIDQLLPVLISSAKLHLLFVHVAQQEIATILQDLKRVERQLLGMNLFFLKTNYSKKQFPPDITLLKTECILHNANDNFRP